jgi:hypothetical protein
MGRKGYAIVPWAIIFLLLMTGILFIRVPLKRALQGKTMAFADHAFWGTWGSAADQYKGDINSFTETEANSTQETVRREVLKAHNSPRINQNSRGESKETSYSWSVEDEDSQALLHSELKPDLRQ